MTEKNNIPKGYKDSAVGIIPQNWEVKTLNECFQISAGRDLQKEFYSHIQIDNYIYPIFSNSLDNRGLYGYTSNPRHKAGSITITRRGMLGIAEYRKTDFDAIVRLLVLYPKIEIKGQLIAEYINHKKPFYFESTGVPQLTAPQIANIHIPIPPLEEQQKIVEILSTWDEAIERQSKLIEKLELRKRGVMQRLLTGRTRLPGFTTPWQKVKLGKIGKFDKGIGVPKDKIISKGCKAITYGEIYTKYNFVIKNFVSYINYDTAKISKQITSGAILFAGSGETLEDIGKCVAFIDEDIAYAGGDIIIFTPTIEINSLVLSYYLNSSNVIVQKRKYGQGHSVVHIYQKDLAKLEFELPSFSEQKEIANILTTIDDEINIQVKKLETIRTQKRGLMQQLLTGKTRVKYES